MLAVICAVTLVFSLMPSLAFAEVTAGGDVVANDTLEDSNAVVSGVDSAVTPEEALAAEHEPGELVVVYEDEIPAIDAGVTTEDGTETTLASEGVVEQEEIAEVPDGGAAALVTLEDTSSETMAEAMDSIAALDGVAYVEPNYSYSISAMPNDTYFDSKQYHLKNCNFPKAWDTSKAENKTTVAVIDTGCNLEHPDLTGIVDKTNAYDAVSGKPLASAGVGNNGDLHGHGTNVCGVVGAETNNAIGVAGASWNASILPVRIFNNAGTANSDYLIDALDYLDYLIEKGKVANLRVINMSINGTGNSRGVKTYLDHLYSAHGVLNVAAGGNGDSKGNPITAYTYPSDYNTCIGVTSTTSTGTQSSWCDYNDAKDIAAPGEKVWSTTLGGSYQNFEPNYGNYISGTSFSSPIVAGAAALMFAKYPKASPYDVVQAMQSTAKTVPNKPAASGSAGQLDAAAALDYLASHVTSKVPSGIGSMPSAASGIPMYRLYNAHTSEHFYTASSAERDWLARYHGWTYEGVGWTAPSSGKPVYRLYNEGLGDHHYTLDASEKDWLVRSQGWTDEGIGWYSGGTVPVYRQYNGGLQRGQHNYTKSKEENDWLCAYHGWKPEGIGWYALQ